MIDTPAGLEDRIASLVESKDALRERRRFGVATVVSILALIALVPAMLWLVHDAAESGFAAYASLIFSDTADVAGHLKEFSLSLLESAPAVSLSLALGALAAFGFALLASIRALRRSRFFINRYSLR